MGSRRVLVCSLLLACASCGQGGGEAGTRAPGEQASPVTAPDSQEVDRLRALGYLDFADEIVDEAEPSVPVSDAERSFPGWNLFVSRSLSLAQLVDARGRVLRAWSNRPSTAWSNAELTREGDLLVQGGHQGKSYLLRFSWEGELIWRRPMNAHHDVEVTPAGEIAVLTYRLRSIPEVDVQNQVIDHQITLLDQEGTMLREYSLFDMMSASPELFTFQPVAPAGGRVDLFHANSVEFLNRPGLEKRHPLYSSRNAIVSIRHQDTIAIFDLEARRLVWAWGQGEILGPHDATVLENGNILLLDNGLGRGWSRVIELDPLNKKIVWDYRAPRPRAFYTAGQGSCQRLPNGNTLITNSDSGEAFEVTPDRDVVWRFRNPNTNADGHRATIVRMKRLPLEFVSALEKGKGDAHRPSAP